MKEPNTKWNTLPIEILSKIFQLVVEEQTQFESSNLTFVCKAWLKSAQLALYSKININSLLQLRKFYSTVENNTYLGELVNIFHLRFRIPENNDTEKEIKLEIFNILSPLLSTYLPNLEELSELALYSYTSTLDALLDSQLKRLKVLELPFFECRENEVANYITCALLMKNRLENLLISDNFLFEEEISKEESCFNRLYNKLHKFEKLTNICIERKTNETIQLLEKVVEICKTLQRIELDCRPLDNQLNMMTLNNNIVSPEEITGFIPADNINSLTINAKLSNVPNLHSYIIHKFPQLNTLSLNMKMTANSTHLDEQMMTNLFNYVCRIENISISSIKIDNTTIADTVGNYWKSISASKSKRVEFIYKRNNSNELQTLLDYSDSEYSPVSCATIICFDSQFNWGYMTGFMSKNGSMIREIQFTFEAKDIRVLPDNFMQHTLKLCFNLQILHLQHCSLQTIALYANVDFSKRLSLHELYLENCELHTGLLERWSIFLPEIKRLRLNKIRCIVSKARCSKSNSSDHLTLEIAMPCTKVDLIIFEQDYSNEHICLKVFVLSDGTHYFYQYNPSSSRDLRALTEQEYKDTSNSKHIHICCQTKPDFLFQA